MKDLCLTSNAIYKIYAENDRQLGEWGVRDCDPFQWLAFVIERLGELSKEINEFTFRGGTPDAVVKEAIKTATFCVKIAEMFEALPHNKETWS